MSLSATVGIDDCQVEETMRFSLGLLERVYS